MPTPNRSILATLVLALAYVPSAVAQGAQIHVREDKKGLLKLAKISPAAAMQTAQAKFPNAVMKSAEIEKEHGRLIYSFDLQQLGVKGIEEVNVDANTGVVVGTEHENPGAPKKPVPKPVKKPTTP
jgi:uncharacterized membrane protein YkoI